MSLRYDVIRYTPTLRFGVCNLLNFHSTEQATEQVTEQVNGDIQKKSAGLCARLIRIFECSV